EGGSWHRCEGRRGPRAVRTGRGCRAKRKNQPASSPPASAGLDRGRALASNIRELFRRCSRRDQRVIVEHRREPLLRLGHAPALARGVVLDLIALDLADAELLALGAAVTEPAR